jgi:hypothetical protein
MVPLLAGERSVADVAARPERIDEEPRRPEATAVRAAEATGSGKLYDSSSFLSLVSA